MQKLLIVACAVLCLSPAMAQLPEGALAPKVKTTALNGQPVDLGAWLDANKIVVVEVMATWCKPCVEELPMLEQLNERYGNKNVKVLLVSLDFKSQLQKRFLPFLETTRLKSEVVLFADQDANTWIPRINEEWDGAIPATYIIRDGKREFHSGRFKDFNELEAFMTPFLKGLASSSASSRR